MTQPNPLESLTHEQIKECFEKLFLDRHEPLVSAEVAALYLGISPKTLADIRQKGGGPVYYQFPKPGSKAQNQKVKYKLSDLELWREKYKVTSSMQGAALRNLTFKVVNDIERIEPFWISGNTLTDHCTRVSQYRFVEHLKNNQKEIETVIWLRWHDAFSGKYKLNESLFTFRSIYIEFLEQLIKDANSQR